jgi:tetratricopeptide (TPR) repeat protein
MAKTDPARSRRPLWIATTIATLGLAAWIYQAQRTPNYTAVAAPAATLPSKFTGPVIPPEAEVYAGYAGDAACQACHAAAFDQWKGSHHGLAERPIIPDLDRAGFEAAKAFAHGTQSSTPQWTDGKASMLAIGLTKQPETFPIDRVIGHAPLRQYLVAAPGGRWQTLEACWDPQRKDWFNVYGKEDRQPGEWGHWTGRGMTWNTMCASCHNTRVRKNYDPATDSFRTTMAHPTVSCESCHGPMKSHATWQASNPGVKPDPTATKLSRDQMLDSCAMCHARRSEVTGDFAPGQSFWDHHTLAIADHTDGFYPDGQIRDEDYEFAPFMASRMHHAGVRCVDCHQPHSAKTILPGNQLCMRCHTAGGYPNAPVIQPTAHTFHGPDSSGSQCINCHMPQTVYMQRHSRHDHGFTIPDPLMTQQFGIPNACNKCHQDKDTAAMLTAVEKWYGDRMNRRTRSRTTALAKAKRADTDAQAGLQQLLAGDETPYWKASAISLADPWLNTESMRNALSAQLLREHPLVRTTAIRTLEPLIGSDTGIRAKIEPLLTDPVRSVRVSAAWALRDRLDPQSQPAQELQHMLTINADQPSGQMQLGQYHYARQDLTKALEHMQRAVQWDPNSPPFHHDLAMMHSLRGDPKAAVKSLTEALRLNPKEAQYHYELGLAWSEAGDMLQTIAALREATRIEPRLSRAWYNLGLALNAQKRVDEALSTLAQGAAANPQDPSLPYVRATIYANLGQVQQAREEIFKALNIAPNMPEALELRAALNR